MRGCITGPDLATISLKVMKKGDKEIEGCTDKEIGSRLFKKRKNNIAAIFGLVATVGTTYVAIESVPAVSWVAATGVGLIACALLVVNNLRDIPTDAVSGKRTLAVRLDVVRAFGGVVSLIDVAASAIFSMAHSSLACLAPWWSAAAGA